MIYFLILIAIVLIFVFLKNSGEKIPDDIDETYPDRTEAISRFKLMIVEASMNGDYELANLNFAKLIEAIRQQDKRYKGALKKELEKRQEKYAKFRKKFNLDYPEQFLPYRKQKSINNKTNSSSELLKEATKLSTENNQDAAISKIKQSVALNPDNPAAYKKLSSYLFSNNQKEEAFTTLYNYLELCPVLSRSDISKALSILHKRNNSFRDELFYECLSIYYYAIYSAPLAYPDANDAFELISLSDRGRDKETVEEINESLVNFMPKGWYLNFCKYYELLDQEYPDSFDKMVNEIHKYLKNEKRDIVSLKKSINSTLDSSLRSE